MEALPEGRDADQKKAALGTFRRKFVHQLSLLHHVQERRPLQIEPVNNRIAYVLHNSLPHSSGGYATRSHGVASGLTAAGMDVVAFTRPGFPVDIKADASPVTLADHEAEQAIRELLRNRAGHPGAPRHGRLRLPPQPGAGRPAGA